MTPKRIAITGYPGTGKTTLATTLGTALGVQVISTDRYLVYPRADRPRQTLLDLAEFREYVLEGCDVARLFRRGYRPDLLVVLESTVPPLKQHKALASLVDRGVLEARQARVPVQIYTVPAYPTASDVLGTEAKPGG